jgi:hypothetical protein
METNNTIDVEKETFDFPVLARAAFMNTIGTGWDANPWSASDVDKLGTHDIHKDYQKAVKSCRFFYRRDPIASIVVNKQLEIAVTGLQLHKGKIGNNQFRVFESLLEDLNRFAKDCAFEYLVSGMVVPEVDFATVTKRELTDKGIKTYQSLRLPESMWVRNPATIKIKSPIIGNKPSYFVKIPEEMQFFIKHKGKYPDGTKDIELYRKIVKLNPELVRDIRKGVEDILLENPYVIRRKVLTDSPYPTPYLYPALESLKHKRNIKKMDYSIAARVRSAILKITLGNDDYPLTEANESQLDELREQMRWRNTGGRNVERIFELFGNHTLELEWIFPPTAALLDDGKYRDVNMDIFYALGFPRILITGETERSATSTADVALLSPTKSMLDLRAKILPIIERIVQDVGEENNFKDIPEIEFMPLNLIAYNTFLEGITLLYNSGNLSRTSYAEALGYNLGDELNQRAEEQEMIEELGITEFAPVPHSNVPDEDENKEENTQNDENKNEN